jgi:hypothetical protein
VVSADEWSRCRSLDVDPNAAPGPHRSPNRDGFGLALERYRLKLFVFDDVAAGAAGEFPHDDATDRSDRLQA